MMKGLLSIPGRTSLRLIAVLSGVATCALGWRLWALDRALPPHGIVCYEFAGSAERATRMFSAWGEAGRAAARESLRYDFGFLVAYSLFLAALTLLAARAAPARYARLGAWLGIAPLVAAVLDALENVALWHVLEQYAQPSEPLLRLAAIAAGGKFLLLLGSMGYTLAVWGAWGVARLKGLASRG